MRYEIDRRLLAAHGRSDVFRHRVDGETVYVKRRRRSKNPLGRLAQSLIHRLSGNPLTIPPPGPGADSVAFEAGRLERLAKLGVDVPRVLHRGGSYFVMSDAGPGLDALIAKQPDQAGASVGLALAALRRLHNLGEAHGGAQIKNITVRNGRAHFIDFEDDIRGDAVKSFQLRDVFLFLFSLERLGMDPDLAVLCGVYDAGGGGTLKKLCSALSGLRTARLLNSRFLSPLGMRDIRSLIRLIDKAERLALNAGKP